MSAGLALSLSIGAASAQTTDLRDCPLDRLGFVDSERAEVFQIADVFRLQFMLCDDGAVLVEDPAALQDDCRGPFGYTVLAGDLRSERDGVVTSDVWAVWSVIPAAPCCSWSFDVGATLAARYGDVLPLPEGQTLSKAATRFDAAEMPRLRDLAAPLAIPRRYGPLATDTELLPMICAAG